MCVLNSSDKTGKSAPQRVNVFGCAGEIIVKLDFGLLHGAQLVDRKLEASIGLVEQAAHFYEVVALKAVDVLVYVVPHFGVKVAGAVYQRQRERKLSALFWLGLLGRHDKCTSNYPGVTAPR